MNEWGMGPEAAYWSALDFARVEGDGRAAYWKTRGGTRGGSIKILHVDPTWEQKIFAYLSKTLPPGVEPVWE